MFRDAILNDKENYESMSSGAGCVCSEYHLQGKGRASLLNRETLGLGVTHFAEFMQFDGQQSEKCLHINPFAVRNFVAFVWTRGEFVAICVNQLLEQE